MKKGNEEFKEENKERGEGKKEKADDMKFLKTKMKNRKM